MKATIGFVRTVLVSGLLVLGGAARVARADEVTDWNQIMLQSALAAVPPTSPSEVPDTFDNPTRVGVESIP